jgi:hypothetical protein
MVRMGEISPIANQLAGSQKVFGIGGIHYSLYMLVSTADLGLTRFGNLVRQHIILFSDHQLTAAARGGSGLVKPWFGLVWFGLDWLGLARGLAVVFDLVKFGSRKFSPT